MQRGLRAIALLSVILAGGTAGYALIEGWDLGRSLFFTLITITTIGYGDYGLSRAGEYFTTFVILGALGVFTYSFGQLVEAISTYDFMRRRLMERSIRNLTDHMVICGLGRMGQTISRRLDEHGVPFVVVDRDEKLVSEAIDRGWLALVGDATDDDTLHDCAVSHARALICAASTDAENIVITLGARDICSQLLIISRAEQPDAIRKLERAGASKIISPIGASAERAIDMVLKPHLADFLDHAASGSEAVDMAEILIEGAMGSEWRSVIECGKRHPEVAFVAVRHRDGRMSFRCDPRSSFETGDVLIVAGRQEQVCRMSIEAREARMAA